MNCFALLPRPGAGRSGCAYVVLCCLWIVAPPASAHAQDAETTSAADASAADAVPIVTLAEAGAAAAQAAVAASQLHFRPSTQPPARPSSLMPLYVSFASLQALDVHSTTRALDRGASEANPLMKGLAGNPLALAGVKVAASAGAIYAAEKMWKKNRKASVIFMVAANAAMALVVQHNYRAVK